MDTQQDNIETTAQHDLEDSDAIDKALQQMAVIFKSRCVQAPLGTNITIREIKKEE